MLNKKLKSIAIHHLRTSGKNYNMAQRFRVSLGEKKNVVAERENTVS